MLVSLEWLNEYVDITDLDAEEIAHGLTMSGLEVEEIEKIGCDFSNIVVAEILEIKPHPDADKLQLATVFNGKEKKEVVCGAGNIAKGQLIPYATIGSEVLDRKSGEKFKLKPVKIRGVASEGMLCSADELGLESSDYQEEDGILILNRFIENLKPGQDVKEVLNIKEDKVLHVAPTANRGDEMSLIGVAREVCSIFNKSLKIPELKSYGSPDNTNFQVEIADKDTCRYYAAGILKNVKVQKSPDWMKSRLEVSGVRSINNIVDITNYVMLEFGQPLHAFDIDKLGENYLSVRRADKGEKIVTLDEVERELNTDSVLIATKEKIVGLAGLMGGFNSEVDENTTQIALESAYFTPVTNRKSSRSVGHRTEASARFERGIDIESVRPALARAMQLMEEIADAKIEGIVETGKGKLPDLQIMLRFGEIKRILGTDIPDYKCVEILENLGFETLGRNDFSAKLKVPSFRADDVTREIDLIEEISRIYGYDKIETTLPRKTQAAEISFETKLMQKIHKMFTGKGFKEAMTSSLIGEPLLNWIGIPYNKEEAIRVTNPHSDEHTMLRQSLIPNIAQVVKYNFSQGQKDVWIYEVGKTYFYKGNADQKNPGTEEKRYLAGAISGSIASGVWKKTEEVDFYSLKGVLDSLFAELGIENRIQYEAVADIDYLHPGRAAQARLSAKKPVVLATFGEMHPDVNKKGKFNQPVYFFEIDLEAIFANLSETAVKFRQLPQFPAVNRDIAFIVPQGVSYQELAKTIKKSSSNLFRKAEIFDLYQGEHVPEGAKSVAFRLTLQDPDTTLTDQIIDGEVEKIRSGLKKAYSKISFRE